MIISDLLRHKGSAVVTVGSATPVPELLRLLEEHHIGGVPVVDDTAVIGIVSERDVVRRLASVGAALLSSTVGELMTTDVISCEPSDDLDRVATMMTEHRVRHLPVVSDGRLLGLVTIGDVVAARLRSLESERRQLEDYITRG